MTEASWELIMAMPVPMEPYSTPAVHASGRDVVRQLRGRLWMSGQVTLTLDELKTLTDKEAQA